MTDGDQASSAAQDAADRFLTFRVDKDLYALPAEDVLEVIRVPSVARVPQAPNGLLGLANLRGSVLPIASLRQLLGRSAVDASATSRAIVLDGGSPMAIAVDSVEALVEVDPDMIDRRQAGLAADAGEHLTGTFRAAGDEALTKILDIQRHLSVAFTQRLRAQRHGRASPDAPMPRRDLEDIEARQVLVTFDVADQVYGLPLDVVQAIVPAPERLTVLPRADALVLGVASYRDILLPLFSLRGLLGFAPMAERSERDKVIVTAVAGALVGLLTERMQAIVSADPAMVEPVPPVLAARSGGESRIKAIYRGDKGRNLVSILSPELLFQGSVMQRLGTEPLPTRPSVGEREPDMETELKFLVFRLGEDEFGLPVEAVDEVARVPREITRVPKAPKFLEGVINLRGAVLPVIDQRRRFNMTIENSESRRLLVVRTDRHRAGLIVDSVSEILVTSSRAVQPAPKLTQDVTRLVHGVVNLERAGRLVLLLDPGELLSHSERGLLDAFDAEAGQVG